MKLEEKIRKTLEKHEEIIAVYLHGSLARGDQRNDSDIDIALLLKRDFEPDALYPARIAEELAKECDLSREIDVRVLNGMPVTFLHQVLKNGVLIHSRDDRRRVEFETRAYDMYLDYKPYFDRFNEIRRRRLLS